MHQGEQVGLHAMPAYAAELAKWRARMVAQFEKEGRGDTWVKDGQLQLRQPATYGPNFRMYILRASFVAGRLILTQLCGFCSWACATLLWS